MSDTDYSKLTNAEIDRLVAEKVMGWHDNTKVTPHIWCNANEVGRLPSTGLERWRPTTDASDSARVRQHLWESGRFGKIALKWLSAAHTGTVDMVLAELRLAKSGAVYSVQLNCTDDSNGFRCLCIAALRAYEQEATRENKQ